MFVMYPIFFFNLSHTFFPVLMLLKIGCGLELKVEKFVGCGKLNFDPFQMEKSNHPLRPHALITHQNKLFLFY